MDPPLVLQVDGETLAVNKDGDSDVQDLSASQPVAPQHICPNLADHQKAIYDCFTFDILELPPPAPETLLSFTLATAPAEDKKQSKREALPPVFSFQSETLTRK